MRLLTVGALAMGVLMAPVDAGATTTATVSPSTASVHLSKRAGGFVDPVAVRGGRYRAPTAPGFSAEINEQSLTDYRF